MSPRMAESCAEVKPGWKTTEFWVSVLSALGAIITGAAGVIPPKYAVFAAAASAGFYSVSRGLAKTGSAAPPPLATIVNETTGPGAAHLALAALMLPAFLFSGGAA